jgi:hypothetical protein
MARGLAVFVLIMLAETGHGILRGLFLVPRVGERTASLIGWPIGVVIVLGITFLTIRWIGLKERRALLGLGFIWLVATFWFEIAIGYLRGLSNEAILTEINPLSGGLMVYSLVVMLLAPLLASRLRGG